MDSHNIACLVLLEDMALRATFLLLFHLSFLFLHAFLPSCCVLSHITSSMAVLLPISLPFSPKDRGIISIWLWCQMLNISAFLKEAICFLSSNVSHAVKWHRLVPSLTKFHRDSLSEARESFEKWVSSLWKYPNYHFLWETQHHPGDLWPSGKVTKLKRHPSSFPVGTPPFSLTHSSWAIENSN